MKIPAIAIHGGSGTIAFNDKDIESEKQYLKALNFALDEGFEMLTEGCSATECVCKAVKVLEDCDLLNAGKGSVFTAKGQLRWMRPSWMEKPSLYSLLWDFLRLSVSLGS